MGARLIDRAPQGSRLTEAGEVFLPQALDLLRSAARAVTSARGAAPSKTITVGYVGGLFITPAVHELRRRHPGADVRTRHVSWDEAITALPDYRVDALIARLPFPFSTDRLHITKLYDEPRVLLVPTSHRLAGMASISLDDFAGEPLARVPTAAPWWTSFWRLEPRPDGRPAPDGPVAETPEDVLELVSSGQAGAVLPAGDRRSTLRPDLTTIPIEGVEPCHVVVATRADDRSHLVAAFRRCARACLTGAAPGRPRGTAGHPGPS